MFSCFAAGLCRFGPLCLALVGLGLTAVACDQGQDQLIENADFAAQTGGDGAGEGVGDAAGQVADTTSTTVDAVAVGDGLVLQDVAADVPEPICDPTACDDKDPCTEDGCKPGGGCGHQPIASGTPCGVGKACVVPLDNDEMLTGHWRFDNCLGDDSSANANVATLVNNPLCVKGMFGNGISFNGTSNYLQVPDNKSFTMGKPNLTLTAWLQPNQPTDFSIVMNKENAFEIGVNTGEMASALQTIGGPIWAWQTKGKLLTPGWHFYALVYDGTTVQHLVDGKVQFSYPYSGNISNQPCELLIGARKTACNGKEASNFFHGGIDEPAIFNRTLSPLELHAIQANQWKGGCIDLASCTTASDCDDSNVCTSDTCAAGGLCQHVPGNAHGACEQASGASGVCQAENCVACIDASDCKGPLGVDQVESCIKRSCGANGCSIDINGSDGSVCGKNACGSGTCGAGKCSIVPISCDDGNVCTLDSCDAKLGCKHSAAIGQTCGVTACATGTCSASQCVIVPLSCDDSNECTSDTCEVDKGCNHAAAVGQACGITPCSTGTCADGQCAIKPVNCDDSNVCTTDACDAKAGCKHGAAAGVCGVTVCSSGTCNNSQCTILPIGCDDSNPCTKDACAAPGGCNHTAVADGPCVGTGCPMACVCLGGKCQ